MVVRRVHVRAKEGFGTGHVEPRQICLTRDKTARPRELACARCAYEPVRALCFRV